MRTGDSGDVEANRRAIARLVDAYEMLADPLRQSEMIDSIKLFHLIVTVEGGEFARAWIGRLTEQVRGEAEHS